MAGSLCFPWFRGQRSCQGWRIVSTAGSPWQTSHACELIYHGDKKLRFEDGKNLIPVIYYTAVGKKVNLGILFAYERKDIISIDQQIGEREINETSGT